MMEQLRHLALSKQGLTSLQKFGAGIPGTLKAIEHLGYVQIDTLSVVERAHHHVLWNRVSDYDSNHLNQLVNQQKVFEYWYHAASYLPMRDYRFALPNMLSVRNGENRYYTNVDKSLMNEILTRIRAEGALRLRDFDNHNKGNGHWWSQSTGRRAFEKLFMQGDLMVSKRKGMEKTYDLAERCLPEDIDLSVPTIGEYAAYLFDTTLRAHGVFTLKQLLHLKTGKKIRAAMHEVLNERIDAGTVRIATNNNAPSFYVDSKALEEEGKTSTEGTLKILSPFDNVLIHRDRLSTLFGFDYRIECYVPAPKRVFGYFCLPLLYGDKFVGRIDCKAHRSSRRFEVLNLHLEDNPLFDKAHFFSTLNHELQRFADFNQCSNLDNSIICF
jgi:uncharacterized protein YcaQ